MISIICATRKRPILLERMCQSIIQNSVNPFALDVVLGFDSDDIDSAIEFLRMQSAKILKPKIILFERMGYGRMHEYLNSLSKYCNKDWILVMGDDAFVKTKNFDAIICSVEDRYLCNTKNPSDPDYSKDNLMHFAIHRNWIEKTGRISPYQQSDTYLTYVAKQAGVWNADWVIEICHVEEGATPTQRVGDSITKEIVYASNIPMDEAQKDIQALKN